MAGYTESATRGASNLINSLINSVWGNSEGSASSSSDLTQAFTRSLLKLPQNGSDEEKKACIHSCLEAVAKFPGDSEFTHPEAAQQVLTDHLYMFDNAADDALYYTEAKWAKSAFRQGYAERIIERRTADAAQQFYHIPLLSDPQERVAAAQKWTEQFAAGTASFTQLAERFSIDPQYFSSDILSSKTLNAFDTYYHQAMQQKGEKIVKIVEQNLGFSKQDVAALEIKAEKDPHSLSVDEKEFFECMVYGVSTAMSILGPLTIPCLEQRKMLLGHCLKLGKSVESASSITESEESRLAFEQPFIEFDKFLAKHLYKSDS